jgi:thioredoxin reductase/NAD-dependent dihydropyrimidine dehydrogenase PreA subunit
MSWITLTFVALTAATCGVYLWRALAAERESRAARDAAMDAGLTEPPSLHPLIDGSRCIGCGSCVTACPEGGVLGLIGGKAELIEPALCIGHGECRTACPTEAIELVFGTERRGMDIPHVRGNFETNVPGLFIAGELGGMGLIRNAIEQGRQAIESIRRLASETTDGVLDVVIVGAGPAGIAASLAAKQHGLRFVTVEQDTLGGTVAQFPRGKLVMTAPAELPLVGRMYFRETTKEELLRFWTEVERRTRLDIHYGERVDAVERQPCGFAVRTSRGTHLARAVLLAIGRRGTPRKLGVPGEERPKVVYRLVDPAQYRGRRILVVGGGDSALEAAASVAGEAGTTVTISYRSEAFSRARSANRDRIEYLAERGRVQILLGSRILAIDEEHVDVEVTGGVRRIPNDAVIVCAGGILPTAFLESAGVAVETKHGTA